MLLECKVLREQCNFHLTQRFNFSNCYFHNKLIVTSVDTHMHERRRLWSVLLFVDWFLVTHHLWPFMVMAWILIFY